SGSTIRAFVAHIIPQSPLISWLTMLVAPPIVAYGILMKVRTPWCVGLWDVVHLGIVEQSSLTLGRANQLVGLGIIILILLLGGRTITVITATNVLMVGFFLDFYLVRDVVPFVEGIPGLLYIAAGVVVNGI